MLLTAPDADADAAPAFAAFAAFAPVAFVAAPPAAAPPAAAVAFFFPLRVSSTGRLRSPCETN